ncbi:hypothetical protein [Arsenophonus nasoniae]|uniref:hypothetical protein n=1 Tax=Arsenophonus nasoniae TaxID=638 RepID=UPI00387A70E3
MTTTYLHVRTPQAGYLATSGKVSDNSWYCLAFACCSELMGLILSQIILFINTSDNIFCVGWMVSEKNIKEHYDFIKH